MVTLLFLVIGLTGVWDLLRWAGPSSWNALRVGLRSSSFGLDTFKALKNTSIWFSVLTTRHALLSVSKPDYYYYYYSSVASNIWNALPNHMSSIPTLPVFRRALKHHLFLLAYPDSSAKSGKIKPAQCITLRDTAPTTATAQPWNTKPPI